ncbi:MAG: YjdF family protein [Candidatus Limiplasma sp.]|nr:YjdF family protein [Candidatus Limiplasma sp.]
METVSVQLTVYFDDPFWVGVFTRQEDESLTAARMVFGAEPKDYEVYASVLEHYAELRFSPPVAAEQTAPPPANPKRMQREAARRMAAQGIGTYAQQALQQQRELHGLERKAQSRAMRDAEDERRYQLRQIKRKQKHRGR